MPGDKPTSLEDSVPGERGYMIALARSLGCATILGGTPVGLFGKDALTEYDDVSEGGKDRRRHS